MIGWWQILAVLWINANVLGRIHIQSLGPELLGDAHHLILHKTILIRRCTVRRKVVKVETDSDGLVILKVVPIVSVRAGGVPIGRIGVEIPAFVVPCIRISTSLKQSSRT